MLQHIPILLLFAYLFPTTSKDKNQIGLIQNYFTSNSNLITGSGATCMAHVDGTDQESGISPLISRIQEVSLGYPNGRLLELKFKTLQNGVEFYKFVKTF